MLRKVCATIGAAELTNGSVVDCAAALTPEVAPKNRMSKKEPIAANSQPMAPTKEFLLREYFANPVIESAKSTKNTKTAIANPDFTGARFGALPESSRVMGSMAVTSTSSILKVGSTEAIDSSIGAMRAFTSTLAFLVSPV